MNRSIPIAFAATAMLFAAPLFAQTTNTWNVSSGNWSNAANWTSGPVSSGATNALTFANASNWTSILDISGTTALNSLTLNSPGTLTDSSTTANFLSFVGTSPTITMNTPGNVILGVPILVPSGTLNITVAPGAGSLQLGNGGLGVSNANEYWLAGATGSVTITNNSTNPVWVGDLGNLGTSGTNYFTVAAGTVNDLDWYSSPNSGGNVFGDYTVLNVLVGATYYFGLNNESMGAIQGAGNITQSNEIEVTLAGTWNWAGNLQGPGKFVQDVAGTTILSGTNTYLGITEPDTSGAHIVLANSNAVMNSTVDVAETNGILFNTGGGTISVFNLGNLEGSSALLLTDTAGNYAANISVGGNNSSQVYSGSLSGLGSVTKVGTGSLDLSGTNTYSGGTTISGGVLQFGSIKSIPATGQITIAAGGALAATGIYSSTTPVMGFLNSAPIAPNPQGAVALAAGTTDTETITLSATTSTLSLGASGAAAFNGTLTPSGSTYYLGGGGGTLTFMPAISGSNGVVIGNGGLLGTVVLNGANSYNGPTTLRGGDLQFGGASAASSASPIVFNGGTLQYTAATSGTDFSNIFSTAPNQAYSIDTNGQIVTLASNLTSSGGSLTKLGAGTLILSGSNTYNGVTTIDAGTLQAGGLTAFGASTSSLNVNGGVLDLGGFSVTAGTVTLSSGSIINSSGNGATLNAAGYYVQNGTIGVTLGGATAPLVMSGNGTFTLSGSNTYGGGTVLQSGELSLASTSAIGTGPIIFNGGTLQYTAATSGIDFSSRFSNAPNQAYSIDTNGQTVTLASNLTSSGGSLAVLGSGILVLTGTNTYNGVTTINAGTLQAGGVTALGATTSLLNVNGGTLDLAGFNVTTGTVTLASGSIINSGTGAVTLNAAGYYVQNGTVGVTLGGATAPLVMTGAGTFLLTGSNTYGGGTVLQNGELSLAGISAIGTGPIIFNGGTLQYTAANSNIDFSSRFSNAPNQAYSIDTNGQTVDLAGNLTSSGGSLTKLGAGTLILSGSNTYSGVTTIDVGTIQAGSLNALGAGNSLLNVSGGILDLAGFSTTAGTVTVAGGSIINSGSAATLNASGYYVESGSISVPLGGAGAPLVKLTGSTFVLTGNNTYGGGTVLGGGTLSLGSAGAIGTTGAITFNGGTLQFTAANTTDYSGRFNNSPNQAYDIDTNGQTVTFAGNLASSGGSLTKFGAGTLILSGSNTFSGVTTIDAGILRAGSLNALGASGGFLNVNGGTLDLGGFSTTAGTVTLTSGSIIDSGAPATLNAAGYSLQTGSIGVSLGGASAPLVKSGAGTLLLTGSNSYGGGTFLNGGELSLGSTGALGTSGAVSFNGGTLQFTAANTIDYSSRFSSAAGQAYSIDTNGQNVNFAGGLTSSGGSLTKVGAGILDLSGSSSYSGLTTINVGTLQLGNSSALGTSSVSVNGGTLDIDGYSATAGTVSLISGSIINSGVSATLLSSSYSVQSGVISAALGGATAPLNKLSSGTVILTASNTYGGGTTISAGTLQLGNGLVNGSIQGSTTDSTALVFDNPNPQTYGGVVSGAGVLAELGSGMLTLTGSNLYTGGTTIGSGTLNLNYSIVGSSTGSILPSGSTATTSFAGGELLLTGSSGSSRTQSLGKLAFTNGASAIALAPNGGSVTLTTVSAAWTRTTGATVNLTLPGSTTFTTSGATLDNGVLAASATGSAYVTLNGTDWAGRNSTDNIVPATYTGTFGSTANIDTALASTTWSANGTANTLAFRSSGSTLTLQGNATLEAGAILVSSTAGSAPSLLTGGVLNTATNELVVAQFDTAASLTIGSLINGTTATSLTKTGPGLLILNGADVFSGGVAVNAGTVRLGPAGSIAPGNTVTTNGGTFDINGTNTTIAMLAGASGSIVNSNSASATLNVTVGKSSSGSYGGLLANTGGSLNLAFNFSSGTGYSQFALTNLANSFTGSITVNGDGTASGLDADGVLGLAGDGVLGAAGNPITLNNGGTLYNGYSPAGKSGWTAGVSGDPQLSASRTITMGTGAGGVFRAASGTTFTVNSVINGGGALTKADSGTLILTNSNNWSGGTNVLAGTLKLGTSNSVPGGTNMTFGNSATGSAATLDLNGFNLTVSALNTTGTAQANQTIGNSSTTADATLTYSSATNTSIFGGAVVDALGAGTHKTNLTVTGFGTLELTGSKNSYSGATNINQGTLDVAANAVMNSKSVTVANYGTLSTLNGVSSQVQNLVLNNGFLASGTPDPNLGSWVLTGTGLQATGASSLISANNVNWSGSQTITVVNPADILTVNGTLAGAALASNNFALVTAGSGTLILSSSNSYSGGTTISSGIVVDNSSVGGGLGAGPVVMSPAAGATATLEFSSAAESIPSLTANSAGLSSILLGSSSSPVGPTTLTIGSNNASTVFDGAIGDLSALAPAAVGNLVKVGNGSLTLGGATTYTGATTINAGTLIYDFSQPGAPGANSLSPSGGLSLAADTTFQVIGSTSAANRLTVGAVTIGPGPTAIRAGSGLSLSVAIANLLRNSGGVVDFTLPSSGSMTIASLVGGSGILNTSGVAYATLAGNDWAGVTASGQIVPVVYTPSTYSALVGNAGVASGIDTSLGASTNVSSLRFNLNETRTISVGSANTLAVGGILVTSVAGTGSLTVTGGSLTGPSAGADLVVIQNSNSEPLVINSTIPDWNGTALNKYGPGNLVLGGAGTFTGNTVLWGGTLTLADATDSFAASTALAQSTLNYNGQGGVLVFDGGAYGNGPLTQATLGGLTGSQSLALVNTSSGAVALVVGGNNQSTIYSGVLSGAGGLTLAGTGTLTLTAPNTYAGATQIQSGTLIPTSTANTNSGGFYLSAGTLVYNVLGNLGATSAPITFAEGGSGGTLLYTGTVAHLTPGAAYMNINGPATFDISNSGTCVEYYTTNFQGQGTLTKTGPGELWFGSGGEWLPPGGVTPGNAGGIVIAQGTFLETSPRINYCMGVTVQPGAQWEIVDNTNNDANSSSGNFSLINVGALVTLNGRGPGNSGALRYCPQTNAQGIALISTPISLQSDSSVVVCNSTGYVYKLKLYGNITGPGGLIKDFSSGEPVNGDTYAQYTANSLGILALGGNNSYQGNTTINAGTILLQSNYALPSTTVLMIDSSNSSTLDMGGYSAVVAGLENGPNGGGIITNSSTGSSSALSTLTIAGTATSSFSGVIQNGASPTAVAMAGPGLLTLAGSNFYTGGTTVSGGTLQLGTNTALGIGSLAIDNGTVDLASNSPTVLGLSGSGGAITNSGTAGSLLTVNQAGATTTFSGTIADGTGPVAFQLTGNGELSLAGANAYSGGTRIAGGTLQLGNAGALGYGGLAANAGVIDLAGLSVTVPSFSGAAGLVTDSVPSSTSVLTVSQTGATSFGGSLQDGLGQLSLALGGGALNLSGTSTYSGGTQVAAGTLQLGSNGALGSNLGALAVSSGGLLDLNGFSASVGAFNGGGTVNNVGGIGTSVLIFGNGNANGSFSGMIQNTSASGSVALVKTGSGTQVLSGVNTYTGGTTLSGGVLNFSASAVPVAAGSITFNGGTLQYAAGNLRDVSSAIAPIAANQAASIDTNGNSVIFGSTLSGSGGLTKLGGGLLLLAASNAYLGTTTVGGGTLQLGNANALPSGTLVANSGVLDLAGQSPTVASLGGLGGTITTSVAGPVALTVGQGGVTAFGGALQNGNGTLSLAFNGVGTLLLTGTNNSFSGATTITNGVLKAGAVNTLSPNSAVTVGNSGTLDVTNFAQTITSLTVGGLGALNLTVGSLLTTSSNSTASLAGTLNLFGSVSGTEELISYGALSPGGSFSNVTFNGSPLSGTSYQLEYNASQLDLLAPSSGMGSWASTSGSWSVGPWTPSAPNGRGQTAVLNSAAAANSPVAVTLDVPVTLGTLLLGDSDGSATSGFSISAAGANALTLDNSGSTSQITVQQGTHAISAPITLAGNLDVAPSAGSTLLLSGDMGESVTGSSLSLDDAGTLILSGSNGYSGGTFVNAGTLQVQNPNGIPQGSNLSVGAGAASLFGSPAAGGVVLGGEVAASGNSAGAPPAVPEPGTLALLLAGLASAAIYRRVRRRLNAMAKC